MPRKVFIAFLGTSAYRQCNYVKEGFSHTSRFIQDATFRYLSTLETWTEEDRILILLTQRAEEKNWKSIGQIPGLEETLSEAGFRPRIEAIKGIPEGRDEKEIYQVFELIYRYLQENDELYFDITHGFRYLPTLVVVLGNYAKFLKKVSINSITYGNWEMSEKGTKPAPIIDLLSLSALQDWTFAAGQFIQSGNADKLIELAEHQATNAIRSSRGTDQAAKKMKSFIASLSKVISERQACRGLDLFSGKSIQFIRKTYSELEGDYATPYFPIFDRIADTWSDFSESFDPLNGIKTAEWCFTKGLYLQAATCLEESVLYYLGLKYGLDPVSKTDQWLMSGALDYASRTLAKTLDADNYSEAQARLGEDILRDYPTLVTPFHILREDIRNDFNHAGIRKNPWSFQTIRKKLEEQLDIISGLLLDNDPIPQKAVGEKCFINISNHPSPLWSQKQTEAAESLGKVTNIPFPVVPPTASEADIDAMAESITQQVKTITPPPATIHIMGEMTLTYAMVRKLKASGYTCVASTTHRSVTTDADGNKVSHFDFIQFREY